MLNKKNSKKLVEAPLQYWEENSYMLVITPKDEEMQMEDIIEKVSEIENVTVKAKKQIEEAKALMLKIMYDEEEYEIGFYYTDFSLSEPYINSSF